MMLNFLFLYKFFMHFTISVLSQASALLAYFFEWVKECKAASRQCLILNCQINIFQISLYKRHGGIVGAA